MEEGRSLSLLLKHHLTLKTLFLQRIINFILIRDFLFICVEFRYCYLLYGYIMRVINPIVG